jgi:hypothetical protein
MMILPFLLTALLSGLRAVAAPVAARRRARRVAPPVSRDHLDHLFACFERLYTEWRNRMPPEPGAPDPRPSAVAAPRPAAEAAAPPAQTRPRPSFPPALPTVPLHAQWTGEAITPPPPRKFPPHPPTSNHAHFITIYQL